LNEVLFISTTPASMRPKASIRIAPIRGRAGHASSSTMMPTKTPEPIETSDVYVEMSTTRPCW
jgi:hypothetical protein